MQHLVEVQSVPTGASKTMRIHSGQSSPGLDDNGASASDAGTGEGAPGKREAGSGIDPALRAFLISIKDDINQSTSNAFEQLNKQIDENAANIAELRRQLAARDAQLELKMTEKLKMTNPVAAVTPMPAMIAAASRRRVEAYNYSRRSSKMWPVKGENLEDSVKVYLKSRLAFDDGRIGALGKIKVVPLTSKKAKEKGQVLATFETVGDRDTVKAWSSNLAGDRNSGIAIHVPGYLMDNFHALNAVGYNIKTKHKGVKRSVKFDDDCQDIFMAVCIGGNWKRITPLEARAGLKKMPQENISQTLSLEDLRSLVQGNIVAGLTDVVASQYNSK